MQHGESTQVDSLAGSKEKISELSISQARKTYICLQNVSLKIMLKRSLALMQRILIFNVTPTLHIVMYILFVHAGYDILSSLKKLTPPKFLYSLTKIKEGTLKFHSPTIDWLLVE